MLRAGLMALIVSGGRLAPRATYVILSVFWGLTGRGIRLQENTRWPSASDAQWSPFDPATAWFSGDAPTKPILPALARDSVPLGTLVTLDPGTDTPTAQRGLSRTCPKGSGRARGGLPVPRKGRRATRGGLGGPPVKAPTADAGCVAERSDPCKLSILTSTQSRGRATHPRPVATAAQSP